MRSAAPPTRTRGCPDLNNTANTNSYYGSIGTTTLITTNTGATTLNVQTTGIFTWQASYGVRDVIDGTVNTIAFAECVVGNQSSQLGQKRIGFTSVTAIPSAALVLDAIVRADPDPRCDRRLRQGLEHPSPVVAIDRQRGENWAHGCNDMTLFNTIVTPNDKNDAWVNCSATSSGGLSNYTNSDSFHPGGVNVMMTDGSVKFIKDSINQRTWWALGTKSNGEVIDASSY